MGSETASKVSKEHLMCGGVIRTKHRRILATLRKAPRSDREAKGDDNRKRPSLAPPLLRRRSSIVQRVETCLLYTSRKKTAVYRGSSDGNILAKPRSQGFRTTPTVQRQQPPIAHLAHIHHGLSLDGSTAHLHRLLLHTD